MSRTRFPLSSTAPDRGAPLGAASRAHPHAAELTLRGLVLGAAITVIFMAANIYLGLKTGMTFSSSIPASVISMAALRALGGAGVLENNMVQTQASAAGTLCNVILVLPGLVLIGYWHGFPYLQSTILCLTGGLLGVMYSIPLRRVMVVDSDLPFPEGIAAAEVLRAGAQQASGGVRVLAAGGLVSGLVTLATGGLRVLGEGVALMTTAGNAVFRIGMGFSLAMLGVGYLVGFGVSLALVLGLFIAWGVAVPLLTWLSPSMLSPAEHAMQVWSDQVRLMGAGIIAVGGVWTVLTLIRPMLAGIRHALEAGRRSRRGQHAPRQERDIPITWVGLCILGLAVPIALLFAWFAAPHVTSPGLLIAIAGGGALFTVVFGFLMATACGYLAGLLGSSSSPISGIGILTTLLVSLLLALLPGGLGQDDLFLAFALLITSCIVTISSIANDNLQDLKTGKLVDATPWRQQVALLVGVTVGALVVGPLMNMLYEAYGFVGDLPRPGMNPGAAMPAPQASLMTTIARGIFDRHLPWTMVLIGMVLGAGLIALENWSRRLGRQMPALTVGIGIYLPASVSTTIALGGVVAWLAERAVRRHGADPETLRRRGVLIASGFLVGESFMGMMLAAVTVLASGGSVPSMTGPDFAATSTWLGLAVFAVCTVGFYRAVSR